jgi:AraC-like DNA-binding protein
MQSPNDADVLAVAADWGSATGVPTDVFDFSGHALLDDSRCFCFTSCPMAGVCDPQAAHRFGCYEAERWEGEYVYYCPASLAFVATLVREGGRSVYGLVAGPLVMGPVEDLLSDLGPELGGLVGELPVRTPAEVGAMSRMQRAVCDAFSPAAPAVRSRSGLESLASGHPAAAYPLDVERELVAMVRRGDRAGASELINQLLGAIYLAAGGDFGRLRREAAELVTVFSRAAIEGGADAEAIFGEKRVLGARLAGFATLDDVSDFLVNVFHRFVGYVFDFSQFQHANALRKVIEHVNTHYADRITLADAARQVFLSPTYLSSVFSSEMGMGFTAYVQSVRVEKSKRLLLDTRLTIAEVAAVTGFADQSYVTQVFAKVVGMSPTRFRRQEADHV